MNFKASGTAKAKPQGKERNVALARRCELTEMESRLYNHGLYRRQGTRKVKIEYDIRRNR